MAVLGAIRARFGDVMGGDVDSVQCTPTFFGPVDRPMFGVLTTPRGPVRGGVVVCPSLGKEQAETTRWLKLFAERLAARGFAVLRFDYPHTGESAGAQDVPGAARRWVAGIGEAVDYLRCSGAAQIVVVGHRAGALLLSQALAGLDVQAAVLWDPIVKGRQYLRSKAVIYNMISELPAEIRARVPATAVPTSPHDSRVHTAGQSLHADAAVDLRSFTLDPRAFAEVPTLLLAVDTGLAESFGQAAVDVVALDEQESYLAPTHPALLAFPEGEIATVVDWIDSTSGPQTSRFDAQTRNAAAVAETADGAPIVTRVYQTESGIMVWDTAVGDAGATRAIFVAHSLGQYVRTGPSRLWFDVAVQVAARGGRAIRFDRLGVGESGTVRPADRELPLYTHGYVDDGIRVLDQVRLPPDARITHAGICVGSWMAAHGARRTVRRPGTKSSVVLVNPLLWRLRPQRAFRAADYADEVALAGTGRVDEVDNSLRGRIRRKLLWLGGRSAPRVRRWVPRRWWPMVGKLPAMSVPDAFFAEFDAAGVDVHIAFAPGDYVYFDEMSGAVEAIRGARGRVDVTVAAAGDHTSYHVTMRQVVTDCVLRAMQLGSPGALAQINQPVSPLTAV